MAASFRSMLDSMMGKDRNAPITERKVSTVPKDKFKDPDLCKYFLCGFCPHDLFINTKVDLGKCANVHDEALQAQWNTLSERERITYGYEDRWMELLQKLVTDIDRKIQRHKERVEEQNAKAVQVDPEVRDRLGELSQEILSTTNRMEAVSEQGDVDTASKLLQELERLKQEKEKIMLQIQAKASSTGNRLVSVCEVCSGFTMAGDTEQRIIDHVAGKQHTGFNLIRETLTKLKAKRLRTGAANSLSSSASHKYKESYHSRKSPDADRHDSRERKSNDTEKDERSSKKYSSSSADDRRSNREGYYDRREREKYSGVKRSRREEDD